MPAFAALFAEVDAEELLLGVGWSFGFKRNLYGACFLHKRHTARHRFGSFEAFRRAGTINLQL